MQVNVLVSLTVAGMVGCASSASEIKGTYVSPLQYQSYTCRQIAEEAERISRRVALAWGAQDQNATNDAAVTGDAVVLFWPAAFMVKGDGQTAAELGRLKGEFEALEKVSIQKNCGLVFKQAPAKPPPAKRQSDYDPQA